MKSLIWKIKAFWWKLDFLRAYNSPFKPPKIRFYLGEVNYGLPYFLPTKLIQFNIVGLGFKIKWSDTDYRFEWAPRISLKFFKWQFCIYFEAPREDWYWEAWLYYTRNTDRKLSTPMRVLILQCKYPLDIMTSSASGQKVTEDYYKYILKDKYV